MSDRLTAKQALEITEQAKNNARIQKKKKQSTTDIYYLTDEQRKLQFDFIHKGIREAAEAGRTEWSVVYSAKNKKGEFSFQLEFFKAVAREFKEHYPEYMVITDTGPLRKLTIKWSGKYEV